MKTPALPPHPHERNSSGWSERGRERQSRRLHVDGRVAAAAASAAAATAVVVVFVGYLSAGIAARERTPHLGHGVSEQDERVRVVVEVESKLVPASAYACATNARHVGGDSNAHASERDAFVTQQALLCAEPWHC